ANGDVEVVEPCASGPRSEVNSIIWPNPDFDNDITVYGPEVKSVVQRYLAQMIDELGAQPDPDDPRRTLLESIELIVPHQANKTMILNAAAKAGLSDDQLYFNIETMGNVSAASIPIALHDAVRDGVIARPTRVFAPGFGAGAVGGYAVMRIDPAVVADEVVLDIREDVSSGSAAVSRVTGTTADDVHVAFGRGPNGHSGTFPTPRRLPYEPSALSPRVRAQRFVASCTSPARGDEWFEADGDGFRRWRAGTWRTANLTGAGHGARNPRRSRRCSLVRAS